MNNKITETFNETTSKHLVKERNWELVPFVNGLYYLRQKDRHYMKSVNFYLPRM